MYTNPESFGSFRVACFGGGDDSAGLPGTAIVGVGASIRLYDERSLTFVICGWGDDVRFWTCCRVNEAMRLDAMVLFGELLSCE